MLAIQAGLNNIHQPLGEFTQWLSNVILFLSGQQYSQVFLDYFLPKIADRLYHFFAHMIDNTYDTELTLEERKKIHDGVADA